MNEDQGQTQATGGETTPPADTQATTNSDYSRGSMFEEGGKDYTPDGDKGNDFFSDLPDEYREKPWVKELAKNGNPKLELFKQVEHANKFIGTKTAASFPTAESTEAERREFYKQLGVPESPEKYEIANTTWEEAEKPLGAIVDQSRNPQVVAAVKQAAFDAGVTPEALNKVINAFEKASVKFEGEAWQQKAEQERVLNQDFTNLGHKYFGDKYPEVASRVSHLIAEHIKNVDPELTLHLHQMDNKSLMVVAAAIDSVHRRQRSEDTMATRNMPKGNVTDLKSEALRLMNDPEYNNMESPVYKRAVECWKQYTEMGGK